MWARDRAGTLIEEGIANWTEQWVNVSRYAGNDRERGGREVVGRW